MLRGVSGGQKRRVTAGEFIVTPSKIKLFDAVTNGLDSATAYDIIRTMKLFSTTLQTTGVLSLLQVLLVHLIIINYILLLFVNP